MTTLTFVDRSGVRFAISSRVAATLYSLRQVDPNASESGGIMLGRYLMDAQDVVVDVVTTPMPGDRQSRFRYFRGRRRHQDAIDWWWDESRGTCNYLGEWHSHPEAKPSPSGLDVQGWRRKLAYDEIDGNAIHFVIVGTQEIRVWRGERRTGELVRLRAIRGGGECGEDST